MGRPPWCVKVGIKKGPWTPDEDIILISYIQEHGPGNWRSVPINTGLMRCSKSCRLRWTKYLRPGIRHGKFTPHEEDIIVHLQYLLGNKWATIASYLPQRTNNDIKNYWNNHLKRKLNKQQVIGVISAQPPHSEPSITPTAASHVDRHHNITKMFNSFMKSSSTQGGATGIIKPSSVINDNPLFPFNHMSGSALPSISDVPPPQLSLIEGWLFDEATERLSTS